MITVLHVGKFSWRRGITIKDLLSQINDQRTLVGAVINGIYESRSHFGKIRIPDLAEVHLIPWQEGMTIAELLKSAMTEEYFSAATIDNRLIPESDFDKTLISKDAEVWLLTPIGGG